MGHYTRQGNKELLDQFIEDQMSELIDNTDEKKIDMIADLVWSGKIQVDDLLEYCDKEIRDYYASQWRPR